jgi:hypothetical protein
MKRPPGVTFTAVLLIVGGSFSLLLILIAIVAVMVTQFSTPPDAPKFFLFFSIAIDLIALACAAWAIAAGVGLLRLRSWARISSIIFAALLLVGSLPGLAIIPAMPSFMAQDQSAPDLKVIQIGVGVFYGLLAALAIWWLYYFNTRRVKDLFRPRNFPIAPAIVQPLVVQPLVAEPFPPAAPAKIRRPVSITVIAAIMLISAAMAPLSLLLLALLKLPAPLLGFWLTGWAGAAVLLAYLCVLLPAGIGLLKLRPWARILSICFFGFGIVNSVVTYGLPGSAARYQQIMSDMMSRFMPPSAFPGNANGAFAPFAHLASISTWTGIVFGFLFAGVQLFFLIKEKPAFLAANQSQPNIS